LDEDGTGGKGTETQRGSDGNGHGEEEEEEEEERAEKKNAVDGSASENHEGESEDIDSGAKTTMTGTGSPGENSEDLDQVAVEKKAIPVEEEEEEEDTVGRGGDDQVESNEAQLVDDGTGGSADATDGKSNEGEGDREKETNVTFGQNSEVENKADRQTGIQNGTGKDDAVGSDSENHNSEADASIEATESQRGNSENLSGRVTEPEDYDDNDDDATVGRRIGIKLTDDMLTTARPCRSTVLIPAPKSPPRDRAVRDEPESEAEEEDDTPRASPRSQRRRTARGHNIWSDDGQEALSIAARQLATSGSSSPRSPRRASPSDVLMYEEDNDDFNDQIYRQLDFGTHDLDFESAIEDLPIEHLKDLATMAHLQVVQRRHWLTSIWHQFDPAQLEAAFFATLEMMTKDDGTGLNGMIGSARWIAKQFFWADSCGVIPSIRIFLHGPRSSGKSSFLRTLFLQFLSIFTNSGAFRSVFIVPLNLLLSPFDTAETFYQLISRAVVTAVVAQRMDLELFAHSLFEAFSSLLTIPTVPPLPRPVSYQDYLRRPLYLVETLLVQLHELYHEPRQRAAFLEQVMSLPITMGNIFGFTSTFLVIDDLDRLRVVVDGTNLLDLAGATLARCQYLVSGIETASIISLRQDWNVVPVADTCRSEYRDRLLLVQFKDKKIRDLRLRARSCGGCPVFVSRFDDICRMLLQYADMPHGIKRDELLIRALTNTEILLDLIFDFGDLTAQDGGPPIVSGVTMCTKRRPGDSHTG
jgi:hypothetical protein